MATLVFYSGHRGGKQLGHGSNQLHMKAACEHVLPSMLRLLCFHRGLGHGGRLSASSPMLPGSSGELMPHRIFSDQRRIQTDGYMLLAFSHHVGSPEVRVTWASHVLCGVNQLREPLIASLPFTAASGDHNPQQSICKVGIFLLSSSLGKPD